MSMSHHGLTKLIEEAAEVIQVAAKAQALESIGTHWDGTDLKKRLEEELGDLQGAIDFVTVNLKLNKLRIEDQASIKFDLYAMWNVQE